MSIFTGRLTGAELIAVERARQKVPKIAGGEGYNPDDDIGRSEELATAGACYATAQLRRNHGDEGTPAEWPWSPHYWKPTPDQRVLELAKAGALIAAAIDSALADLD